jgi:hypothetical protein
MQPAKSKNRNRARNGSVALLSGVWRLRHNTAKGYALRCDGILGRNEERRAGILMP